jgi:hypothetical protein
MDERTDSERLAWLEKHRVPFSDYRIDRVPMSADDIYDYYIVYAPGQTLSQAIDAAMDAETEDD